MPRATTHTPQFITFTDKKSSEVRPYLAVTRQKQHADGSFRDASGGIFVEGCVEGKLLPSPDRTREQIEADLLDAKAACLVFAKMVDDLLAPAPELEITPKARKGRKLGAQATQVEATPEPALASA